jgi:uncharacterized damage-inducible protein DinB
MLAKEAHDHLRYNRWATLRLLEAFTHVGAAAATAAGPGSFATLRDNFLHVLWVDHLWLARLRGGAAPPQPDSARYPDAAALRLAWEPLLQHWIEAAAAWVDAELAQVVRYRNTRGDDCTSTIQQIVLHLVNHDSYHRGQIAHRLRALGIAPPSTDLIVWYREVIRRGSE